MKKGSTSPADIAGVLILVLMLWAVWEPLALAATKLTAFGGPSSIIFGILPFAIAIMIVISIISKEEVRRQ